MRNILFLILASFFATCNAQFIANPYASYQTINPATLTPDLWIDNTSPAYYTSTVDNLSRVVDQVITRDATAFTSTAYSAGVTAQKPRYNGEGLYVNGSQGYTLGTTSDWNAYHNGTAWTAYFVFKNLSLVDATASYRMMLTSTSASQIGFFIGYYNRSATSNQKTLQIYISNGSGGTAQFLINGSANSVADNDWNVCKIKFTGTSLTAWVKKKGGSFVQIGQDNTGSTSASNAANSLNICGNGTAWKGYFRHYIAFKRALTAQEETDMDTWATVQMNYGINLTPVNVYLSGNAQSNFYGRGDNASIAVNLSSSNGFNGKVGAYTYYWLNGITKGIPYWAEIQVGVTSNPDAGETYHGLFNRFGYEMCKVQGHDVYLMGYAVSSTQLKAATSTVEWNTASVETGDLYPKWKNTFIPNALEDIQHVLRKTPVIRGMIIYQGEQDATPSGGGTTYQADQETWVKTATDDLIALGLDCTKMRIVIHRINNYASFDATAKSNVRTAQVNVATQAGGVDFSSYIPSKFKSITWVDTDSYGTGLHHTASEYDAIGLALATYFHTYANE